jgi:hypothetical protein
LDDLRAESGVVAPEVFVDSAVDSAALSSGLATSGETSGWSIALARSEAGPGTESPAFVGSCAAAIGEIFAARTVHDEAGKAIERGVGQRQPAVSCVTGPRAETASPLSRSQSLTSSEIQLRFSANSVHPDRCKLPNSILEILARRHIVGASCCERCTSRSAAREEDQGSRTLKWSEHTYELQVLPALGRH